jgi:hypothetical protein
MSFTQRELALREAETALLQNVKKINYSLKQLISNVDLP